MPALLAAAFYEFAKWVCGFLLIFLFSFRCVGNRNVPLGVAGAFEAWPRFRAFPTPSPIFLAPTRRTMAVAYGPPRDPATLKGMTRAQMLETLQGDIEVQIRRAEAIRRT